MGRQAQPMFGTRHALVCIWQVFDSAPSGCYDADLSKTGNVCGHGGMKIVKGFIKGVVLVLLSGAVLVGCQIYRNSATTTLLDKPDEAIRFASHNVHYILVNKPEGAWSLGDWNERKASLDAAFKMLDADVIAFQEMESFTAGDEEKFNYAREWLLEQNPDYSAAAVGDWREFPSTQPILYRHERLVVEEQGWFFFSDTPDTLYSRTYNGSYPAFASWARFHDRESQASFRIINVHFDFRSLDNRLQSAALVAERVKPWIEAGESVILAGDLNARLGSATHDILETAGLSFTPVQGATYHLGYGLNLFGAIDHLAYHGVRGPVSEPVVVRRKFDDQWPSDHYPLLVDIRLQ